ncbi:C2 and GRAM domain-containing protein [Tanacetum coccineum]
MTMVSKLKVKVGVVSVAIIEGTNLGALDSSGFSDPYVVLTCNEKTSTSLVKLQTLEPQWDEILEFDAVEEPPSLLDVEVFDFDGPLGEAASPFRLRKVIDMSMYFIDRSLNELYVDYLVNLLDDFVTKAMSITL